MEEKVTEENQQPTQYKRKKRKKSFLQKAKKYAKRGCYGHGTSLDETTYQYFIRIMEVYREGFSSEEDKSMFVDNVFVQTENEEINCSCNQVGCRVIEMLLPFANDKVVERFMQAFSADLRPLCSDRFASHVIQTLLTVTSGKSITLGTVDLEYSEKYREFTKKVSKFLLNNLEDYVWDTYGNHVIRTVFICLSQNIEENNDTTDVEYSDLIKEYAERLIAWPQFNDLPDAELTSGMLQILLEALARTNKKLLKAYIKKLLNDNFSSTEDGANLPHVFMSTPTVMLLETVLKLANFKLYTQIYAKCFVNKLVTLSTTRSTNFAVQKLLNNCKEKAEFDAIFDELEGSFKNIIDKGHSGVILALGQACKRVASKQGNFVQKVMQAFNCFEPEERQNNLVMCLVRFLAYEELEKYKNSEVQKEKLHLHGTLIVQLMLEFNKPIKIVNSILNMDQNELKNLLANSMGSHITDSFAKSSFVGEKSRDKLIRKLQGTYQDLASSKYGSRSFDAIWDVCNIKRRMQIMEELSHKDGIWINSEHGKIIGAKVKVVLFKRDKEEWKNSFDKASKVQKMFADILS